MRITRRSFAVGSGAALAGGWSLGGHGLAADDAFAALGRRLGEIEAQSGGRLGVAILDTQTGGKAGHRGDERFPMCSTFKALAAAAVLARVDAGEQLLTRRIRFEASEVVPYSPATKPRAGGEGMTLAELCEAAITLSDNTAANLLLANIGGPAGLTGFARRLGDAQTRLDRSEPELNEALPGDARDTTTPAAMLGNLHELVLGDALEPASRDQLTAWLLANKTGDARLRAGLPKDWRVGDKTGSGARGTVNDIAVIWPPQRTPLIATVYLTGAAGSDEARNATHAAVGKAIAAALAG